VQRVETLCDPRPIYAQASYYLALLAEAYGKVRQAEEGLSALAEALSQVDKTGERYYEAELYRLRGELTLAQSSVERLESRPYDLHYVQISKSADLRKNCAK